MKKGTGALARSLAGHDRGNLFIIIGESEEYVSLVDGKIRPLAKPKSKNKKHIQMIHDNDEPQRAELIEEARLTDEAVRRIIAASRKEEMKCLRQT